MLGIGIGVGRGAGRVVATGGGGYPAGFYVDPAAGNDGNAGGSPEQAWASYVPVTLGGLPVFRKQGASWVDVTSALQTAAALAFDAPATTWDDTPGIFDYPGVA